DSSPVKRPRHTPNLCAIAMPFAPYSNGRLGRLRRKAPETGSTAPEGAADHRNDHAIGSGLGTAGGRDLDDRSDLHPTGDPGQVPAYASKECGLGELVSLTRSTIAHAWCAC